MSAPASEDNLKFHRQRIGLFFQKTTDRHKLWVTIISLLVMQIVFASLGYEGRKILQISVLLIPTLLLLLIPINNSRLNLIRAFLVWSFVLVFLLDSAVRAHLISIYAAAPDSTMVVSALANTNTSEIGGYISTHIRDFSGSSIILIISAGIALWLSLKGSRKKTKISKIELIALSIIILISAVSYISKPWRRINPLIFWSNLSESLKITKDSWASYGKERALAQRSAKSESPSIARKDKSTVVLVISESINRDNMGIYGYARNTTPMLEKLQKDIGDRFLVIRNSWSTEATTIPAIDSMMNFTTGETDKKLNIIALAKEAGYKTWWISNHDDIAITQKHAAMADVASMENNKPGRSSNSLDEILLPSYENALKDSHPRKLIVLHMLGAHPHYRLRYPEKQPIFTDDEVSRIMSAAERSMWVQEFRNDYDSAVVYQDRVVASVFEKLRSSPSSADDYKSIIYVSDHGQEVGHQTNKVGHSPSTASGYKIPTIIWTSTGTDVASKNIYDRPFRSDWLAWTMSDLMALRWNSYEPSRSIINPSYSWVSPSLPIKDPITGALLHISAPGQISPTPGAARPQPPSAGSPVQ
ncbi:phosphoethanolamine transferase [Comamonas sp. 26]|uniref:phosphoethanolamine transferase n=1 Tax=Comamonas sp. 26 TaxID=2035201 RepID=UPI000C61CCD9|nr:phosphoethanolamine transferase [Comamonas sp. 26]PIG08943.1 heptose-I-phosphate ethanolaminephosphotransferase [Comamonas sp. 26]